MTSVTYKSPFQLIARLALCMLVGVISLTHCMAEEKNDRVKFFPPRDVTVAAGDTATIVIKATLDKGWHTYSNKETVGAEGIGPQATEVNFIENAKFKIVRVSMSPIHRVYDSSFAVETQSLSGNIQIRVLIRAPQDLPTGPQKVKIEVYMERCDSTGCLRAIGFIIPFQIAVTPFVPGAKTLDSADMGAMETVTLPTVVDVAANARASADGDIDDARKKGLWSFFLLGMLIGLGALATPCVYPMVPITVSFFTKRSEKNKAGQLTDAAVFAGGIVLTFTLIGIIVSALWGASQVGNFAADPWTNLIIGLLFVVLAFNLFGAFEIQVPVSILNLLNKKSQGTGYSATFLMGVTFAVISFTCTGAFVAGALGSANQGDYLYPTVGMLGFALSFAAPFFILALAPSLMTKLPRSGGWMNNVKVVLGFLEIAFALKFLSSADLNFSWGILPRDVVLAIWIGVAFLIVLYLLGTFRMKLDSPLESVSGIRAAFAIAFASVAFWLFTGFGNRPLGEIDGILPPLNYEEIIAIGRNGTSTSLAPGTSSSASTIKRSAQAAKGAEAAWFDNLDAAKAEAKKTGKPIFIDFTGFTCTNCRWMEQNMFTRTPVSSRMSHFVLVRLFTDRRTEPFISNQQLQEKEYGSLTLPLYVLLSSDGAYVSKEAYTRDEHAFTTFLDRALPQVQ